MFRADLHCHTTCSDGSCSPEEVVERARQIGLCGLSITDHDTTRAYPRALAAAKKVNLRLGVGIELSSDYQGINVHILGYHYDLTSKEMEDLCKRHYFRRKERNFRILERLEKLNMPIEEEELLKKGQGKTVGRPHIAQLMVEKGYVPDLRFAFQNYLGEEKKAYVPGEKITVEETIATIHAAHGKAFLAHPHLLKKKVSEILNLPFDGIECYYAHLPADKWLKVAEQKKWLISGGSDFHGIFKLDNPLGCATVDEKTFNKIFS